MKVQHVAVSWPSALIDSVVLALRLLSHYLRAYKRLLETWICYLLRTLARKLLQHRLFSYFCYSHIISSPTSFSKKSAWKTTLILTNVVVTRRGLDAQKQLARNTGGLLAFDLVKTSFLKSANCCRSSEIWVGFGEIVVLFPPPFSF